MQLVEILKSKWRKLLNLKLQGRHPMREYWKIYRQIRDMLKDNSNWGASRIHSELFLHLSNKR
ncbi:hypothetical protein AYB33_17195 [Leptospira santarosai]|uniref:Uncharacterized protein n=1 Tax=Leptospira santarosai str. ZUN179 TaxID=1049985 RepID=M6USL4_9LEPT|nr:hypothetical protein LEP1GSC187_2762 [Leptospira santarosai str. ZUN179]KXZ30500.1 hypothetical protein AYB33_17195 [Leptospira santarosai]